MNSNEVLSYLGKKVEITLFYGKVLKGELQSRPLYKKRMAYVVVKNNEVIENKYFKSSHIVKIEVLENDK